MNFSQHIGHPTLGSIPYRIDPNSVLCRTQLERPPSVADTATCSPRRRGACPPRTRHVIDTVRQSRSSLQPMAAVHWADEKQLCRRRRHTRATRMAPCGKHFDKSVSRMTC
ncbi:hypothetical protein MRX96_008126 [Rhipicephalus microplus]